jgi:hypothetical protein
MGAPSIVAPKQLRELHIRLAEPARAVEANASAAEKVNVDKAVAPDS